MRGCIGNAELWQGLVQSMGDEITMDAAWEAHKALVAGLGAS